MEGRLQKKREIKYILAINVRFTLHSHRIQLINTHEYEVTDFSGVFQQYFMYIKTSCRSDTLNPQPEHLTLSC